MASPIPPNDGPLLPWLQNFCIKFPTHGPILGFTLPQMAAVSADCNMLIYLLQTYVPVMRHDAAEATKYKDVIKNGPIGTPSGAPPSASGMPIAPTTVAAGVIPRLRFLIQEIKNKPAYNQAIGTDLGIIAATPVLSMDPPVITVTGTQAGHVTFDWSKNGWTGVKVQARLQGTPAWLDLGIDLHSPYADTRPLTTPNTPEIREYRICHMDGDTPLLNWSDIAVVTVTP